MSVQAWEKGFERTWEGVTEDEHGRLQTTAEADLRVSRQRRAAAGAAAGAVRRGMIRYLYIAIDLSTAMQETDLRPGRLPLTLRIANEFIQRFFDQNPLSQLGILVTRDGRAERITELSGSPKAHIEALKAASSTHGNASLQNVLELALASLQAVPEYGSREVLVLYASLSTCDPGDIHGTAARLKQRGIRVSMVGVGGGEMFICRKIAEETGGEYSVATDERHYEDAVLAQTTPPPTLAKRGPAYADMVQMGFPKRQDLQPSIGYSGKEQVLTMTGYLCPRCKSKTIELPSTCVVCQLPLVSAPHLARSYHHLFPVPIFKEVVLTGSSTTGSGGGGGGGSADGGLGDAAAARGRASPVSDAGAAAANKGRASPSVDGMSIAGSSVNGSAAAGNANGAGGADGDPDSEAGFCAGCLRDIRGANCQYECPDCGSSFCIECDMYVHDSLHNCPGCC